ncbi:MAG: NAD(P)H-hydrate dehydratase, partial [Puniceicoccaceae bacterium]|nr:NAD(P)H-hydrate dehydratase [Puniceicoccaceae bacterium]
MEFLSYAHPALSCQEAKVLESRILVDEAAEWTAMKMAGQGIAQQLVQDYTELCSPPECLRILALIGKGNNGGDALIACGQLLADFPRARVFLILTLPAEELRPLAVRALQELEGRVEAHQVSGQKGVSEITQMLSDAAGSEGFHICIDGLLGMAFSPPLCEPLASLIEAVNTFEAINLRASVDLPSGKGDSVKNDTITFQADFTYATGIAKKPIFEGIAECGRIRYVDLGFFKAFQAESIKTKEYILTSAVLDPLRSLRPAAVDKRAFGHLFIVGGSAYMPGALLMAVQAAVRSGVGLVTAFAPASVASALAAQVPEAMWIPWPETGNGTLSPHAMPLLLDRINNASAVLVGPGMGKDRNTQMVTQEIVELVELPILLDADALRVRVMKVAQKRRTHYGRIVITPHMGEFMRIAKLAEANYSIEVILDFSEAHGVLTVLKGANTRICDGKSVIYNTQGGPVLSRGGSGDLLSGLIGGMIAQNSVCVPTAVAQGIMLHGMAAQLLARAKGQIAVHTTQLLDYLPKVL